MARFVRRARIAGLRRLWDSKIRLLFYLLAIVTLFTLEFTNEIEQKISGQNRAESKFFEPAFLYQKVTKAGNRRPRSHYVRLVTFDPLKEPQWLRGNECNSRSFEAKLLNALSNAHPALIVLDEYFPEDDCVQSDQLPHSQELRAAVRRLTDEHIPIVIAEYSLNSEEQQGFMQKRKLNGARLDATGTLLLPRVHFDGEDETQPLITYGSAALDDDNRRIPTSWSPTYRSQADLDAHKSFTLNGLAFQAAKVYDTSPVLQARLESLDDLTENPFASFLKEDEFVEVEALDVMCGNAGTPSETRWQKCSPSNYAMKELAGHIVLVGDSSQEDTHISVLGDVHGLLLQANYIECLLDDRVLLPVPCWIELAASLFLLALIEFTFRFLAESPVIALVFALAWILSSCLLCYLIVLQFGYYMYIWIPGVVAVVGECLSSLREKRPPKKGCRKKSWLP
jgi:hypothetical protein